MSWFFPVGSKKKHISQNNDGSTNTQRVGDTTPQETMTYQRSGEIAGGGTIETILDIPDMNCELQSLSMGTDNRSMQLQIAFYKEDGTLNGSLMIANADGMDLSHPTPLRLNDETGGENDFWSLKKYDETNNQYVLTMKRPLKCYNGVKIIVANWQSGVNHVAINAAVAKAKKGV